MSGRILYVNEDYALPSGGVRAIYRHVDVLRRHGFDAYVLHRSPAFHLEWFSSATPVLNLEEMHSVDRSDVVVIPETFDERTAPALAAGRQVLNCQNHYYLFRGLADRLIQQRRFEAVLCGSEVICRILEALDSFPKPVLVPSGIDDTLYRPEPKVRQIALMPRKRPVDGVFIRRYFDAAFPEYRDVPWCSLEGATEAQAADTLARSAVFLSLARLEGLGRPALEAMAAGCVVVGFHGGGGTEYAHSGNGLWCEEWDLVGCAHRLAEALALTRSSPDNLLVRNGRATAARFSMEAESAALLRFWQGIPGVSAATP